MKAEFIELPAFTRAVETNDLPDEWLATVQEDLLLERGFVCRPRQLAGFFKKRVANPMRGKGKSGGFRLYYARYDDLSVIVLALLTDKDVEANISPDEQRCLRAVATDLRKEVEAYVNKKAQERASRRDRRRR